MNRAAGESPRASVVTMTFNRPAALRRCLASLATQTLPSHDFEVVVVDVSTPPVTSVLAEFTAQLQLVHCIAANAGVAANRNAGVERARGSVLAFLDDDCCADPSWLSQLVHTIEQHPRTLAAAPVVHDAPYSAVATAGQVITEAVHRFYNPPDAPSRFLPGLNFALRRDQYLALGGCDASYGLLAAEDRDFADRWRAAGGTLQLCGDTNVHHDHRSTLPGFVRQYVNYGRGAWRYHQRRRQRRTGRMTDDVRLHTELPRHLRGPLGRLPLAMRVQTVLLLGVWQLANAAGFAWQAIVETVQRRGPEAR